MEFAEDFFIGFGIGSFIGQLIRIILYIVQDYKEAKEVQ
jgi:hypothetical protein